MSAVASTAREGLDKYDQDNWVKGMPILDTLNHVENHIAKFKIGDTSEDHLGHAAWNLLAIIHFATKCNCHKIRKLFAELDDNYILANGPEAK